MAYVHKIIAEDEKLIGIARLHWIYIITGMMWFFILSGIGFALNMLMNAGMGAMMNAFDRVYIPAPLLGLSSGIMMFSMAAGFLIFMFYVIKVISTNVALTERRVIHKQGLIFVNVHQIDLEEIRGENLDLGYFGRFLGYGYLMLDCRFIGDVKLPAIEKPERFLRALHDRRANAQDALNLVVGKSGTQNRVNLVNAGVEPAGGVQPAGEEQKPEVSPVQPTPPQQPQPEILPPQPDQIPPPPNQPMPNQPPPMDSQSGIKPMAKSLGQKIKQDVLEDISLKQNKEDEVQAPASLEQVRAQEKHNDGAQQQQAQVPVAQQKEPQQDQPSQSQGLDSDAIAKVIEQVTPQITQQVMKEMAEKGLLAKPEPSKEDNPVDNNLIHVFDDAALDKDGGDDNKGKVEYAVH